jgi:TonB family protein
MAIPVYIAMRKRGESLSCFVFISLLLHVGLISLTYSYHQIDEETGEKILLVNLIDTLSKTDKDYGENTDMNQNTVEQQPSESMPEGEFTEATVFLDAPERKFASYLTIVKRKIDTFWDYPVPAQKARMDGSLALQFSILRTGLINRVRLLRSSGYTELDDEALRAITVSSPFPPLPENLKLSRLNILATFEYRIDHE